MSFDYIVYGSYGDEKKSSSSPIGGLPLGAIMELPDGRRFRHGRLAGTASVAGAVYEGTTPANANTIIAGGAIAMAPSAAAVGDQTLTVTPTGTATPASTCALYADGYLVVSASAGNAIGQTYKIDSVSVATAGSAVNVKLKSTDTIVTALQAGTSFVQLIPNEYSAANITTGDTVGVNTILGVATVIAAASSYIWFQTRGLATCLDDGTTVQGNPVSASSSLDGAVGIHNIAGSAATSVIHQGLSLGWALLSSGTSTNHTPVNLWIE